LWSVRSRPLPSQPSYLIGPLLSAGGKSSLPRRGYSCPSHALCQPRSLADRKGRNRHSGGPLPNSSRVRCRLNLPSTDWTLTPVTVVFVPSSWVSSTVRLKLPGSRDIWVICADFMGGCALAGAPLGRGACLQRGAGEDHRRAYPAHPGTALPGLLRVARIAHKGFGGTGRSRLGSRRRADDLGEGRRGLGRVRR
jgi:hypothetical protein